MHNAAVTDETRYGQILPVLERMNWSWADLQDAPIDLVSEIALRIAAQAEFEHKRQKRDEQMNR